MEEILKIVLNDEEVTGDEIKEMLTEIREMVKSDMEAELAVELNITIGINFPEEMSEFEKAAFMYALSQMCRATGL